MSASFQNAQDLPLLNGFSKWLTSNFQMPVSASTWFAQIVLLMLTWYTMKFTFRLVMSVLWPLVIISTVLVIFHSIHYLESHGLEHHICEKLTGICNFIAKTFAMIPGLIFH